MSAQSWGTLLGVCFVALMLLAQCSLDDRCTRAGGVWLFRDMVCLRGGLALPRGGY